MSLEQNVADVMAAIDRAAARSGRSAAAITLVAVSKTHPPSTIEAAYAAGLRHFGENRSHEFEAKAAALAHLPGLQWHFIGTLQTRQSGPIAAHAHAFHAVDRVKIAARLSRQLEPFGRSLPVFVEVNVSGESSKAGFDLNRWEEDAAERAQFVQAVATVAALPRIEVKGLMTMAPWGAPEAAIRRVFKRTRRLAEWLQDELPDLSLTQLSMGMTDDYEIAIEEGATHIRVGRALFGEREK